MRLPTLALAELIAAEWAAQDEQIVFAAMPATRLAFTALDRIGVARELVAEEVARYAGSDLLCYFADGPGPLIERELRSWGPLLDWAEEALGLAFERVTGIVHRPQPQPTVEKVRALALALGDLELTGLAAAAGLFGSAILALALQRRRLPGDAAFELSRLDEAFQEERWGVDAEAAERTARLRTEAQALQAWFEALAG